MLYLKNTVNTRKPGSNYSREAEFVADWFRIYHGFTQLINSKADISAFLPTTVKRHLFLLKRVENVFVAL